MFAIALFSCGGEAASVAPQPEVAPEAASASTQTAAERYAECKSRVELPEADGECASDPDCAVGGCNSTVCTTSAVVADGLMTTCDVEPCAEILDACRCAEGRCQWSLKSP